MAVCVPESELRARMGFTAYAIEVPEVCLRRIRLVVYSEKKDVQKERPSFFGIHYPRKKGTGYGKVFRAGEHDSRDD